jgi:hypothetical protein
MIEVQGLWQQGRQLIEAKQEMQMGKSRNANARSANRLPTKKFKYGRNLRLNRGVLGFEQPAVFHKSEG